MMLLVFIGAAVTLAFNIPYAWATIKGRIQPNKVSWLLWTVAPAIGFFASISHGFSWGEFPVLISASSTALIFVCSLVNRRSYWAIERFDIICGFMSISALIIWGLTKNPLLAIIFAILGDVLACLPTIIKAWHHPETEGAGPYCAGIFNAATSYFAMSVWSFVSLAFPTYLLLANALLAGIILRRKIFRKQESA
jgi:hypothetical protein